MKPVLLFMFLAIAAVLSGQIIDYTVPEDLQNIISEKDYRTVVDLSIEELNKHAEVAAVDEGEIRLVALNNKEMPVFYAQNVVKKCLGKERKTWDNIIENHFAAFFDSLRLHETLDVKNFEAVKPYLSIRLFEESFVNNFSENNWITKTDLENTTSVLMLDMKVSFATVTKDVFELWNKPKEELFRIAQENVNKNQIFKHTELFSYKGSKLEINVIQNEAIGSSFVLDLARNAPEYIGELGSVIAVPNKGFVIAHRITENNPLDFMLFIQANVEFVNEAYVRHPQPVSKDFYWYYMGKFTKIEVTVYQNEIKILAPLELSRLISGPNY